jgi:hypothetical protein
LNIGNRTIAVGYYGYRRHTGTPPVPHACLGTIFSLIPGGQFARHTLRLLCISDNLIVFLGTRRISVPKSSAPSIEPATAQPTRQSSQWLVKICINTPLQFRAADHSMTLE